MKEDEVKGKLNKNNSIANNQEFLGKNGAKKAKVHCPSGFLKCHRAAQTRNCKKTKD